MLQLASQPQLNSGVILDIWQGLTKSVRHLSPCRSVLSGGRPAASASAVWSGSADVKRHSRASSMACAELISGLYVLSNT